MMRHKALVENFDVHAASSCRTWELRELLRTVVTAISLLLAEPSRLLLLLRLAGSHDLAIA